MKRTQEYCGLDSWIREQGKRPALPSDVLFPLALQDAGGEGHCSAEVPVALRALVTDSDDSSREACRRGVRRINVRKTFTLDPESIAFIDEICQARNSYSDLIKSSFIRNQSQVVRDAINLLYRFEVGKESLVHDEDPRFM